MISQQFPLNQVCGRASSDFHAPRREVSCTYIVEYMEEDSVLPMISAATIRGHIRGLARAGQPHISRGETTPSPSPPPISVNTKNINSPIDRAKHQLHINYSTPHKKVKEKEEKRLVPNKKSYKTQKAASSSLLPQDFYIFDFDARVCQAAEVFSFGSGVKRRYGFTIRKSGKRVFASSLDTVGWTITSSPYHIHQPL